LDKEKKKKGKGRIFRVLARILLGISIFFVLLILFIRSPWGQNIIVNKATSYVSDKTNTKVEIERLFITFAGNVHLEGLFMEDQKGDTLVYSKNLEIDVPIWPIIRGKGIAVSKVEWEGLKANVIRLDSIQGYNFQFLIDAFAAEEAETVVQTDTTSSMTPFRLDRINFSDFDLVFRDAVMGIDSRLKLGELNLRIKEMNLEEMQFHIANAEIKNSDIYYLQTLAFSESEDREDSAMPRLIVDNFEIVNVTADYQSITDGLAAIADIGKLTVNLPKADLTDKTIDLEYLGLLNSNISLKMTSKIENLQEEVTENTVVKDTVTSFTWPDWVVGAKEIAISNINLEYSLDGAQPITGTFNANALTLQDFNFEAKGIYLQEQSLGLNLETFSFKEASGINLEALAMDLKLDEKNTTIENLDIRINENKISGELFLQHESIDALINRPENLIVNADLPGFELSLKDVFRFQPQLRQNEYMRALSRKKVSGNLKINGTLAALEIPSSTIRWGNNTRVTMRGTVFNVTDTDNMRFDFPQLNIVSTRFDLLNFVKEEDLGISIPKDISIAASFSGDVEDINATALVKTTNGDISIKGDYFNKNELAFEVDLDVMQLQLDKLLDNDRFGEISLTLTSSGSGNNVNDLDAIFETNISSLQLQNYAIKDLSITGDIENGQGFINSSYKDENIDVVLETLVQLDSVSPRFLVDLNLKGADLYALGLTNKNVRGGMVLRADFKGNADDFEIEATIIDGIAIYNEQTYLLGNVDMYAFVEPDTTSVVVFNKMLQLDMHSNTNPTEFTKALQRHLDTYFSENGYLAREDTLVTPVELCLKSRISNAPILRDIFLPGLQELDTVKINVDFQERVRNLTADVRLPHINYNGNLVDSLSFRLDSDAENFDFVLGFNEINAGPLSVKKTSFIGEVENNTLFLDFNSIHKEETFIQIKTEISREEEIIRFHVDPSELIFNKNKWIIPQNNEILLSESKIDFNDFRLSYDTQLLSFRSDLPNIEKEHMAMEFDNFRLSGLLSFLNPEENLVRGVVNGDIILEELFGSTGIVADIVIDNFEVVEVPLGTLSLDASSLSGDAYDFNLSLKGGDIDLDLTGDFQADEIAAAINLDLNINEIKMQALDGFTGGQITDGEGNISGQVKISGTTKEPIYNGDFKFNNAAVRIAQLNSLLRMPNEDLRVNNDGIYLSNFTIQDEKNNNFTISGEILTETLINPTFDLQLKGSNFQLLNSTRDDNDLFYGKATFDLDATITGNLNIPKINTTITIKDDTDVTYIIPESELDIIERDGVVLFVNREDPEDILTRTSEESVILSGFQIDAIINIEKDAAFNIIINERTDDNLRVTGEGNLNFNLYSNGRTTLSGRYLVNGGHFEMNLYNLVKRRFEIAPGGRITWSGDPMDADMDIRAIYRVETAATPLMAARLAGTDASVSGRYRQQLPFLVYLNVSGEFMEPKLNFSLDMQEDERGALGGEVYGRIQQVNQQEEEVNKQVFSLLVLNRFFPESGSDGSAGGAEAIARDNVNQALSGQLNTLSDKLLGKSGIELDFGLDSFTDYQGDSPQDRTQLDITAQKKLFDDRLVVSVGSEVDIQGSNQQPGEASPIIGNVSVEYLLTDNGRFRLKAFRKNQYENVIDGQLIVSGIALIFTREFNRFAELWQKEIEQELQNQEDLDNENEDAENNDN